YWVAGGQTQQGPQHGNCQPDYPRCGFPEQLFIDDAPLRHVGTLEAVEPGSWYFDYGADKIYLADDPRGHHVQTRVPPAAFQNSADNVTITGLTIEKYANLAQNGAVSGENRSGWSIRSNEVRWNHGVGIRVSGGSSAVSNFIHHNGETGIIASGSDVLVE